MATPHARRAVLKLNLSIYTVTSYLPLELPLPNIHFSFSLLFKMKYSVSNWHHSRPKNYFPRCIELFGQPTFVANVRHGYALWKTKGLFTQHLLIDEDVKHCVPRPHHDYFYSSVKFYIPPKKVCDVLKISGSINYDGLKKELTARCGGIGANYATIYLGMLVASGKLSLSQVKSKDMYPRMIRGEIIPHKEMAKKMMHKRENNKSIQRNLV